MNSQIYQVIQIPIYANKESKVAKWSDLWSGNQKDKAWEKAMHLRRFTPPSPAKPKADKKYPHEQQFKRG